MSRETRSKQIIIAVVIWCVVLGGVAGAYRFVISPFFSDRLESRTDSDSQYAHTFRVAVDSFSGYSILRSSVLQDELKADGIRLRFEDDQADYAGRMKALESGKADLAVFTIDSFIAAGAEMGSFPASIILVLDETQGADAVVAYESGVSKMQDMDDPDARFVLTPDSPSEFLARVILAQFSLPSLPDKWAREEDGAEKVYKRFKSARQNEKRAYILWEPFVSQALEEEGAHVLLDSSQLKGYIVDVLVARREVLAEKGDTLAKVVESYLRAAYSYRSRMVELVREDAKKFGGGKISGDQAKHLVEGIHWKNTQENYAHFGLAPRTESKDIQHLEDIVEKITQVLMTTRALDRDPLAGKPNTIYYDDILRGLRAEDFHPAQKISILDGVEEPTLDPVAAALELPPLSDAQWDNLAQVGELRVKPIAFGRGGARINVQSQRELEDLAKRLASLPNYYVVVVGNARAEGNADANRALAEQRAAATVTALRERGLHPNRVRARTGVPSASGGSAQSVSFIVGQPPY